MIKYTHYSASLHQHCLGHILGEGASFFCLHGARMWVSHGFPFEYDRTTTFQSMTPMKCLFGLHR